jgi:hypothetical protein
MHEAIALRRKNVQQSQHDLNVKKAWISAYENHMKVKSLTLKATYLSAVLMASSALNLYGHLGAASQIDEPLKGCTETYNRCVEQNQDRVFKRGLYISGGLVGLAGILAIGGAVSHRVSNVRFNKADKQYERLLGLERD